MKLLLIIILLCFISMDGILVFEEYFAPRYDEWNNRFDYSGKLVKAAPCDQNRLSGYFNPFSCPNNEQYYLTHGIPVVSGFGSK